jgi:hypothetical protein
VRVSIGARLVLDCSSIVPRLLAGFAARYPENHRWTQMNTDSADWASALSWYDPGRCPVSGFPRCKSAVMGSPYLCSSVSIWKAPSKAWLVLVN